MNETFNRALEKAAADTESVLERLLGDDVASGEIARPARLLAAMRHGTLGGGKRLRPFLLIKTANLFDVPRDRALMAAAALECVHAYSLVHDDLPSMDNDDLRRGRPTVHKAFDEATAILTGDALLTIAFDAMSRDDVHPDAKIRIALVNALARAAGIGGMAGGQMLDLAAEGRFGKAPLTPDDIGTLQAMKTGALIGFACRAGALLGGASSDDLQAVDRYGRATGQAFQIADDLLDLEGDAETVGKQTGKDAAAGKATLVAALGAPRAREKLATLVREADTALMPFGDRASVLRQAAQFVAERRT